ncbi:hypothetical protein [Flammeovirga sp. SJP92]|uniref:hypothetical protein n=1 Tax=Flammeovirga sp. SJP92 TaxID=1775430 RepID=UPI000789A974|nr:hypothetical protein [Flammeovirga sp. SJP92]KXX66533.1 hypothetical protein AVL50_31910 [Flammeovirga sp. SJP92]
MRKLNLLSLLMAGFLALSVFSCSSEEDEVTPPPTQEELQEQTRIALAATSDSIFNAVVESDWKLVEFVPSAEMLAAKDGDQIGPNTFANTKILRATAAEPFDMTMSFNKEGDVYAISVDIPAEGDDLYDLVLNYQNTLYPDFADWGILVFPQTELVAEVKEVLAGSFAKDDVEVGDTSDPDTGEITIDVKQYDVTNLSYEDMLLNYTKVIEGNSDRVFFIEEGQLIMETTDNIYGTGTSHYVFKKAE